MRNPRPGLPWSRGRVRRRGLYCEYMASPEWFRRRERWLEHHRAAHGGADPVCVVCGGAWTLRHGDLHHRTYCRLGAEAWEDLIAMYREHHGELHALMEENPPGDGFRASRRRRFSSNGCESVSQQPR